MTYIYIYIYMHLYVYNLYIDDYRCICIFCITCSCIIVCQRKTYSWLLRLGEQFLNRLRVTLARAAGVFGCVSFMASRVWTKKADDIPATMPVNSIWRFLEKYVDCSSAGSKSQKVRRFKKSHCTGPKSDREASE